MVDRGKPNKLPDNFKLTSFRHCGEPVEVIMGTQEGEDADNYQTFGGCRKCHLLILIKKTPWDSVEIFMAENVTIN